MSVCSSVCLFVGSSVLSTKQNIELKVTQTSFFFGKCYVLRRTLLEMSSNEKLRLGSVMTRRTRKLRLFVCLSVCLCVCLFVSLYSNIVHWHLYLYLLELNKTLNFKVKHFLCVFDSLRVTGFIPFNFSKFIFDVILT